MDATFIALNSIPIFGATIVVFGNHFLCKRRDSSTRFRDAMIEQLDGLYPLPVDWPDDIDDKLRKIFPELQIAVAEFRPYVLRWRRHAFDRAWYQFYCNGDTEGENENYSHYLAKNAHFVFKRNVDRLLSFA